MAVLIRPRRWGRAQPPAGSTIDHGHPLAHGLVLAVVYSAHGGTVIVDHVRNLTASLEASPAWVPGGVSLSAGAGQSAGRFFVEDTATQWPAFTMDVVALITGSTTGIFCYFGQTAAAQQGAIGCGVGNTTVDNSGTNLILLNETVAWHNTSTAIPQHQWNHIACRFRPTNIRSGWLNGRLAGSEVTEARNVSGTSPLKFGVGANNSLGRPLGGQIATARLWRRALTSDEISWLAAEPYAIFTPPGPLLSVFAVSTSTIWQPRLVQL